MTHSPSTAARLSVEHRLPMADSIILATALAHRATLWTQDADFENVNGVRYLPKRMIGSTANCHADSRRPQRADRRRSTAIVHAFSAI